MLNRIICIALLILMFMSLHAAADENNIYLSGEMASSVFIYTRGVGSPVPHKGGDISGVSGRIRLLYEGYVSDTTSLRFQPEFTYSETSDAGITTAPEDTDNTEVSLREASVRLEEFPFENSDLIIGKQRISWGTADGLNPTDNFNPDNVSAFMGGGSVITLGTVADFFDKPYVWGMRFEYYQTDRNKFDVIWLPRLKVSEIAADQMALLTGIVPTFEYPWKEGRYRLNDSSFGVRYSTLVSNFDFSLSYFRGFDDLPVTKSLTLQFDSANPTAPLSLAALELSYPKYQVIGLDFSGEKASIGLWGEFAYYTPEDLSGTLTLRDTAGNIPDQVTMAAVLDKGFVKYTLGTDYTFSIGEGLYASLQYSHGLFDERRYTMEARQLGLASNTGFLGSLQNYFLYRFEYSYDNDEKKFALMGFLERGDLTTLDDNHGHMYLPYFAWKTKDNTEISIGLMGFSGKTGTKFGMMRGTNLGFFNIKVNW